MSERVQGALPAVIIGVILSVLTAIGTVSYTYGSAITRLETVNQSQDAHLSFNDARIGKLVDRLDNLTSRLGDIGTDTAVTRAATIRISNDLHDLKRQLQVVENGGRR